MSETAVLVGAIVSLVGVIVWAVRFMVNKLFGADGAWDRLLKKFDGLSTDLSRNTATLERLESEQTKTNESLFILMHTGQGQEKAKRIEGVQP